MASRPRHQLVRVALGVLLTAAATACAHSGASPAGSSDDTGPDPEPLTIEAPAPTRTEAKDLSPLPTVP
jgi:hypothetical protein